MLLCQAAKFSQSRDASRWEFPSGVGFHMRVRIQGPLYPSSMVALPGLSVHATTGPAHRQQPARLSYPGTHESLSEALKRIPHTDTTEVGADGPPGTDAALPHALPHSQLQVQERHPLYDEHDDVGDQETPCERPELSIRSA